MVNTFSCFQWRYSGFKFPSPSTTKKKKKIYNVLWRYKISSYMRYPKKNLQLSIFIQDFFFSFFGFMSQWLQTTKQGYRTKEKELRRKNLNWGIHPEKEIQLMVYDEANFSANIYCKTEESLKLEHKTKTFLFEKLLYEIWEPIRLSNLIYKQILITMNI